MAKSRPAVSEDRFASGSLFLGLEAVGTPARSLAKPTPARRVEDTASRLVPQAIPQGHRVMFLDISELKK